MGRTLQELGETLTAQEYGLWWAEYCRSPWGELRQDTGFGIVAATIANTSRSRDSKPFSATDFMPWHEAPQEAEAAPTTDHDGRDEIFALMNGTANG